MKKVKVTKLKVFLAILILAIIGLVAMSIRHQYHHHQLDNSINALQISLKQQGINTTKTSGCGRPYSEVGLGYKSCSIALTVSGVVTDEMQSNEAMKRYATALGQAKQFVSTSPLPHGLPDVKNGIDFGSAYYYQKATGANCAAHYTYSKSEQNIQIDFSCNDTSWFTRTFNF